MHPDLLAPSPDGPAPGRGLAADGAATCEPGLRERQKRARREALIDAAHGLVEELGLDGVTVEAICARADVSTRTFFNYFESKDDAVLGVEPTAMDDAVAAAFAAGGPTGSLLTDLEHLLAALTERPAPSRERIARAMELARHEPRLAARQVLVFERHHGQIADLVGRRVGLDPDAPRVEMLTLLVMALCRATFATWEAEGKHGPVPDVVPRVVGDLRALLEDRPVR